MSQHERPPNSNEYPHKRGVHGTPLSHFKWYNTLARHTYETLAGESLSSLTSTHFSCRICALTFESKKILVGAFVAGWSTCLVPIEYAVVSSIVTSRWVVASTNPTLPPPSHPKRCWRNCCNTHHCITPTTPANIMLTHSFLGFVVKLRVAFIRSRGVLSTSLAHTHTRVAYKSCRCMCTCVYV